jgi:5-hydroxyisourate hydrolase-like protein (transthyretin family)
VTIQEDKDLLLKRVQIFVAILAGITTLVIGVYNVKKNVFAGNGNLTAIVRSDKGSPVSNARVDLYNSQNALVNASETNSEGRYVGKDLEAGSYVLKVTAGGYEPQVATVYIKEKRSTDLDVVLRSGQNRPGGQLQSALEEAGASWIQKLGKPKAETADQK